MRNKNSKVRITKRKLSKCDDVCRTYSDIQYAYAGVLENDSSVAKFSCNVLLVDFELGDTFTTDFVITKTNGDISVRECVTRDKITKPLNIKLLNASQLYWQKRGIQDWGIVTNAIK